MCPPQLLNGLDWAVQYDMNYRLTMAMLGRTAYRKSDDVIWRATSSNRRHPNAMDIDTMTAEKRTSLMKPGLCFKCQGRGHLAKDCKGKKKDNSSPKKNINDIHAMLMQLTEDEKKGLLLRLQTIKTIVNSRRFKGSSCEEPRRMQVLELYCLTRFESENSRRGDVY